MPSPVHAINTLIARNGEVLDAWAKAVQGPLGAAARGSGPAVMALKDVLHGVWLGHPLHPALTDVPLGHGQRGVMFDLAGVEDATDASFAVGSLAAVPTALAGTADWQEITDEPRRVGFVHAGLNVAELALVVLSLRARASGSETATTTRVRNSASDTRRRTTGRAGPVSTEAGRSDYGSRPCAVVLATWLSRANNARTLG